ncbi:MAG: hypothetical protein AMJ91_00515 [candidate division Zixibacteria bacterium SM23_73_3]|nr:MAG: hypothetical protein AMJ91_00515 [candidate division Zixibacteria bacterium SM23_73_3]
MIRLKKTQIFILLSFLLLPALTIFAQGQPPPSGDRPGHMREREKIRENIETLHMYQLLEVLALSSDQSIQFLPALKDFQNAKRRFQDKRTELLRELEFALESEKGEQKLKEILAGLENARKKFQIELEKFLAKTKATLTLEQQAKLRLFEEKFERRLKETIQQIRGKGRRWRE